MEKQNAKIDKFIVAKLFGNPVLIGTVSGHPKLPDDRGVVITSPLKKIDFVEGVAETENTFYKLGEQVYSLEEAHQGTVQATFEGRQ